MVQIQVGGHRGGTPIYADIDEEDFERINKYNWSKNTTSNPYTTYAKTKTKTIGTKHLHRVIMGLGDYKDDKRIINHIDGNGLNNIKSNLEICDVLYNNQSFRRHHGKANVGVVYYDTSMKRIKRWKAQITINKITHTKRFLTEQEGKDFIKSVLVNV